MRRGRIVGRLRNLEVQFVGALEIARRIGDASLANLVVWRLSIGDWQSALILLAGDDRDVWRERYLIQQSNAGANALIAASFSDLARLRAMLMHSLARLSPEQRYMIARRLLAAEMDGV